jgi:hypothetical protein
LEALSQQLLVTPFGRHHSRMPGFCYLKIASTPNRVFMRDAQKIHLHRPRGASRPRQDSIGGNIPGFRSAHSGSAGHLFPTPDAKPKPGPNHSKQSFLRREPMEKPLPHDVLPWPGWSPGPQPISSSRATHDQMENPSKLRARSREDPEDLWPGNDSFRDRLYDVRKDLSTANFLTFRNQEPF